ncbi:MAG: biotin-dependent carboxyltransferase family protein [Acidobacteria bacterium]|nr:MAG: biotin-dependent carboxyltransferase family protein [Acidobacteriota bacterium]
MTTMKVLSPGMMTTIQDLGRFGYQRLGIAPAGAMDTYSLRLANLLAGNQPGAACLEITLLGPQLEFTGPAGIALTGADLTPQLNGKPIEMWATVTVSKGDVLGFGTARSGCRAYLACGGGIDVRPVLGSRATLTRAGLGGTQGRPLAMGDEIRIGPVAAPAPVIRAPSVYRREYAGRFTARIIPGPQDDFFAPETLALFASSAFTVRKESDRMGVRLAGPRLVHRKGPDIVSDALVLGSIQVPGDGYPIVMAADRPTTGGYPKIGTVITPDMDGLGQLRPGDEVRFAAVSLEQADRIYRHYVTTFTRFPAGGT